jgi:nitrogen regulatory protein PII
MKMIVAFVQPFMTEKVVQALHTVPGLSGASFAPVHGFGRGRGDEPGASRHAEILGAIRKTRVEVMVTDALADTVVKVIREHARTGRKGDGKVYVVDLTRAIRIRTGDEGDAAV